MVKPKKKGGIASPAIHEGHHATHDAPDNPQNTPLIPSPEMTEDLDKDPRDNRGYRRSTRLRPTDSTTLDTGNDPVSTPVDYNMVNQRNDHDDDHDR
jgi:hypothetical protein